MHAKQMKQNWKKNETFENKLKDEKKQLKFKMNIITYG